MSRKSSIIIYCNRLLPYSETFVRSQAEALEQVIPHYVGLRFVQGLPLPEERTLVLNQGRFLGKLREVSAKLWQFPPSFVQKLRNLNPALIHAHFGPNGATALPLGQDLQIPLLVTFHGYDASVNDEYTRSSFYSHRVYIRRREALKCEVRLFIAVSEFVKKKLLEQGFPPDKILVHYIGVDTKLFQPNPAVQRQSVVLFVGRLVEKKGCEYLIRAMSKVQVAMPDVKLVVIGDGPLRSNLEQLAGKMLGHYCFLGVQPPESVRSWMQRAKVFCVPSITAKSGDSEGFGLVFAEAQAMGLPVVSFATGGITEAVAHGKTGFLVTERDWEGLAKHIILLLEKEELWQWFSQKGQERVRNSFDLHKQTSLLEEIYKQVLSEKRST